RKRAQGLGVMLDPERHVLHLLDGQQAGAQAVVDIVVVVGNLVGKIGELSLHRWLRTLKEAPAKLAERGSVHARAMLENTLACLEGQIQPIESAVALLKHIDHEQALEVVLEAP